MASGSKNPQTGRGRAGERRLGLWLAAGMALSTAPAAFGQFMATQGGNALSANLSSSSALAGRGRDFAAEAKYRNSIVFSTAPGGMSFQGRLGYKDPAEFVGRLGTNTLNNFKRNSELSTIAGQGVRREQVFDAQSALASGGVARAYQPGRGAVNFNKFQVPGSAYGKPQNAQGANGVVPSISDSAASRSYNSAIKRDEQLDRNYNVVNRLYQGQSSSQARSADRNARLAGLGSTSAYTSSVQGGDLSERLGTSSRIYSGNNLDFGRTDYGAQLEGERTLANSAKSRGQAERMVSDAERSRTQVNPLRAGAGPNGRIDTSANRPDLGSPKSFQESASTLGINTSYDDLRKRLDKLGVMGGVPDGLPRGDRPSTPDTAPSQTDPSRNWQDRINELRDQLLKKDSSGPERMSLLDRSKTPARPGERKAAPDTPEPAADGRTPREPADTDKTLRSRIDPETLKMIRDASGSVDTFVSGQTGKRDFYTENMKSGQQLLADRMYFDAEERFSRALSLRPGDVAAQTGQIHAQIGAGLALSAGQHLRRLLAEHPETTGQRYASALRPDPERTQRVVEQLRTSIAGTGKVRREAALLLAYLGFQTSSVPLTREGLDAMARIAGEDPQAKSDERLVELLRGVWLDPKMISEPAPSPPPPAPAPPALVPAPAPK